MSIHLPNYVILSTDKRNFLKWIVKYFHAKARKDEIMDVEDIMYVFKGLVASMVLPRVNERHLAENAGR